MILTLTINPAIDRNIAADRLAFEDRAYILSRYDSAGGRGINASCVIHSFGGRTHAIATAGGQGGEKLRRFLDGCGYPVDFVPIQNEIRTNLAITDEQGLTIKLNEHGPKVEPHELASLSERIEALLPGAAWLMICGSMPPGAPRDFYASVVRKCHEHKVKCLVDSDGHSLLWALEARPTAVTPNQTEAERLLDSVLITKSHTVDAVRRLRDMGAESVIVSLGARGAVGLSGNQIVEAIPPRIDAVCPIGAGDALAAAFTWSMEQGNSFAESVRWGVAAGTASAGQPGLKFANLQQTKEIFDAVELRLSPAD